MLDKAAPAPSATKSAGKAQQISVLELANKLSRDAQKPVAMGWVKSSEALIS
jgi:hypothetical protein